MRTGRDSPHPCAIDGSARPAERPASTALSRRSLIRPPWPGAATRDENRAARPSSALLVRQSPLLRGRFSFQDEGGGSSPPRPTIRPLTSRNAAQPLELSRLLLISKESTRVGPFQQPHASLTSTFAGHWA